MIWFYLNLCYLAPTKSSLPSLLFGKFYVFPRAVWYFSIVQCSITDPTKHTQVTNVINAYICAYTYIYIYIIHIRRRKHTYSKHAYMHICKLNTYILKNIDTQFVLIVQQFLYAPVSIKVYN